MPTKYLTFFALLLAAGALFLIFVPIADTAILPMLAGALLLDIIGDLTGK